MRVRLGYQMSNKMDGSDVAEIKLRDEVGIDIDKLYEEEITGGR